MPDTRPLFLLHPHPATPASFVRNLEARVFWSPAPHSLNLHYCLHGDISRLRIPAQQAGRASSNLWEHTCFEAFLALPESAAYREFNFSPSGQWASYAFSGYRSPVTDVMDSSQPTITTYQSAGRIELKATLPVDMIPPHALLLGLRIGLNAVIESADTQDGAHSYWALSHLSPRPDFHQRGSFMILLPPVDGSAPC